jgi:hypothetical protein
VNSWEQFAIVKQLFLDIPGFTDKGRNAQRLYYQPGSGIGRALVLHLLHKSAKVAGIELKRGST